MLINAIGLRNRQKLLLIRIGNDILDPLSHFSELQLI
jgi:hypothetical protein